MEEVRQDAAETTEEEGAARQDRAWFPYITKVQFERFLARLDTKIPDQIDRDYVRPIIRTPSMIHRFLRGIESMNLTDRDQKPTDLLLRMIPKETRKFAFADVARSLYKDLLPEWEKSNGSMSDDAIIDYFRDRTGMGRDSANKMKMFFKYLVAEADFGPPADSQKEAAATEPAPQSETPEPAGKDSKRVAEPAPQGETPKPTPQAQENRNPREPAPKERSGRDGRTKRTSPERQERQERQERSLTETQRAYLETLQSTVQIKIDGDWDEDMIRVAFDRLERLFDRLRRT